LSPTSKPKFEERFINTPVVKFLTREEIKMGVVIIRNAVKRKPGHLYYIDGKGNVCEAKMARGGRKKKR